MANNKVIDMDDDSQYLLDTMTDNEYYGYARKKRRKIDEYNKKMKRLGFAGTSTVPEDESTATVKLS
jgi:hypothetical protein